MQDRTLSVESAASDAAPVGATVPVSPASEKRSLGWHLWPRMTEEKWRTSDDAVVMLDYALGRTSARKLRHFAAACYRRLAKRHFEYAEAGEWYADGLLNGEGLSYYRELLAISPSGLPKLELLSSGSPKLELLSEDARWAAYTVLRYSPWHAADPPLGVKELADLLRHIVGNPFRPFLPLERLSATLRQLAEAVYAGESCTFALRDALFDAGHADLAEHFQHDGHPKGCWALDAVLGRE